MIDDLSLITMSQFVDLLCGDESALRPSGAAREEIDAVRAKLAYQYSALSDPAGAQRMISLRSKGIKARMSVTLFSICSNLVAMGRHDEARQLLSEYGYKRPMSDTEIERECSALLNRAKRELARLDEEKAKGDDDAASQSDPRAIREGYDRQCASLMAYFKFQIDMKTMPASQFACLVAQCTREIKARQAALAAHK